MNLDEREKYENWFRATYGKAPMPRTSPAHDFCWAGYKAGAASRNADVVSLTNQRDYEYVRAENAEQERDQFEQERDQLREELEITLANMGRVEETHSLTLREVQSETMRLQTENDQLREQVKMLRDALEIAIDHLLVHFTEEMINTVAPLNKIPEALAATDNHHE